MKKKLLFIFMIVAACAVQAQPALTSSWSKSQTGILATSDANYSNKVAITESGEMFATGLFNTPFTFAGTELENIATSSYILKYSSTGAEVWGVAISGAATIKAITTDASGNVYVAGNLADEVVFNTISGSAITLAGMKADDGTYLAKQSAGFIAKYDANGVLKDAKAIVPQGLPSLVASGMYFPEDGDLYFNISKIEFSGDKLYASALFTGLTTLDGISFEGNYFDLFGVMFMDLSSGAVFAMDSDLKVTSTIASLGVNEPQLENQVSVMNSMFTINEGTLYSGFVATGDQLLTIGSTTKLFNLFTQDGNVQYGYILSAIDLATNTPTATELYSTTHNTGNWCTIGAMNISNNNLIVSGSFNTSLAFDNSISATSTNDIFVAILDATSLAVSKTAVTALNEGQQNQVKETLNGVTVVGDYALAVGYTALISGNVYQAPLAYWVNINTGAITSAAPSIPYTGVAATATQLATAQTQVSGGQLENIFAVQNLKGTSISSVSKENAILIYPNPVVDVLNFSAPCDVTIVNLVGATVRSAQQVTSINVSDLSSGNYIVRVTTENGVDTYKVLKK